MLMRFIASSGRAIFIASRDSWVTRPTKTTWQREAVEVGVKNAHHCVDGRDRLKVHRRLGRNCQMVASSDAHSQPVEWAGGDSILRRAPAKSVWSVDRAIWDYCAVAS
jgi:hypothetical protein